MAELAARHRAVHVDLGTGDGHYVARLALAQQDLLVIGVDANADGLRESSRKVARKRARNALFGRMALEDAPGELCGLADAITVLLPWGSLLRALAGGEPSSLARLHALARPGASLRVVFGYGSAEEAMVRELGLPPLDDPATEERLGQRYRDAGFTVTVRRPSLDEVRALPTTWAKKLAFSGRSRSFVELLGTCG